MQHVRRRVLGGGLSSLRKFNFRQQFKSNSSQSRGFHDFARDESGAVDPNEIMKLEQFYDRSPNISTAQRLKVVAGMESLRKKIDDMEKKAQVYQAQGKKVSKQQQLAEAPEEDILEDMREAVTTSHVKEPSQDRFTQRAVESAKSMGVSPMDAKLLTLLRPEQDDPPDILSVLKKLNVDVDQELVPNAEGNVDIRKFFVDTEHLFKTGKYPHTIGGFVGAQRNDPSTMTPDEASESVRLDYRSKNGEHGLPRTGNEAIAFVDSKMKKDDLETPLAPALGGSEKDFRSRDWPHTGTGFSSSTNPEFVPERVAKKRQPFSSPLDVLRVIMQEAHGQSKVEDHASYDPSKGHFVPVNGKSTAIPRDYLDDDVRN